MEIERSSLASSTKNMYGSKNPRKSFIYNLPFKESDFEDENENQENSSSKNSNTSTKPEKISYSNSFKRLDSIELRKMFSDATGHNLKFEAMDLKSNGIKDKGCIVLAEYLNEKQQQQQNGSTCLSRLRILNLGLNGISDDGFKTISESIAKSNIERLSLWGNDLTDNSLELFFNTCVIHSKKLSVVDFGLNRFTSKGIEKFIDSFEKASNPNGADLSPLIAISFSGNSLGTAGVEGRLLSIMQKNDRARTEKQSNEKKMKERLEFVANGGVKQTTNNNKQSNAQQQRVNLESNELYNSSLDGNSQKESLIRHSKDEIPFATNSDETEDPDSRYNSSNNLQALKKRPSTPVELNSPKSRIKKPHEKTPLLTGPI